MALHSRRARVFALCAALLVSPFGAGVAWAAGPAAPAATTTTAGGPTGGGPTGGGPTGGGPTGGGPTGGGPTASSTTSTTAPGAGAVGNLQLNAINAQFVKAVEAEVGAAQDALTTARAQLARAQAADAAAASVLAAESQRVADLDATQRQQAQALESARARLRDLAVDAYVSGGPAAPVEQLLRSGDINQFARREGYFTAVANAGKDAISTYTRAQQSSTRTARAAADGLQRAEAAKAAADADALTAQAVVLEATTTLSDRVSLLTLTSDAVTVPNTDIPRMVLDAYQRAATAAQAKHCNLAWWGLAGIGKVESDHGRAQDAHLAPNGDLVPHIMGVALTGQNGTALIQDPSGDFAHAEGPMQFIPTTWAKWGQDGNGDNVKDADNVYDAALGAAMYLCATSTDLETDAGLTAAYFSYNHSNDYATEVLAYAKSYQQADAAGLIPPMTPQPLWVLAPPTTSTTTTSTTSTTTTVP